MKADSHSRKYLKDYRPADFTIVETGLEFHLDAAATRVRSRLRIERRGQGDQPLRLDGVGLKSIDLRIDDRPLPPQAFVIDDESLTIARVPDRFELFSEVEIDPAANTRLEGLYLSNGNFCTQCEAEGFRHITWYLDRPDVMAVFTVEVHAERQRYPLLLSNGNLEANGETGERHWVRWHDPFPKPAYLFALVAGDLAVIEDQFVTRSGRAVTLRIYTEHHNARQGGHAMLSLQKAMLWDEQVFGLEYDLDLYMIVAVDDFNMGAMENKGLNVFNTRYVLANAQTATDDDYLAIEGVIAHEYFHNWTGNRVTCRDWFQLSLKEGLTVFRDQEFSADMFSRAIQRIGDVRILRNHQFAEDAGPMAHPVRPSSYQEINNFYTATVYNKGAEVVRMMHCLLGVDGFRAGMDLYFERHDGQAVTTDDFCRAMQDASGVPLERFQRWYRQSGTPRVSISRRHDPANNRLTLEIEQHPGVTRDEANQPFHLPMRLALFSPAGEALPLDATGTLERVVDIVDENSRIDFDDMPASTLVSAFRGFSAPIVLSTDLDNDELARLMVCDSDAFNRWDASQQLASRIMLAMLAHERNEWDGLQQPLLNAFTDLLDRAVDDRALLAEMLVLPGEKYLAEMLDRVDVHALRRVRESLKLALARAGEDSLFRHYLDCSVQEAYRPEPGPIARRRLRNICLDYLVNLQKDAYFDCCGEQFEQADNMTEQIACLHTIVDYRHELRDRIVTQFYQQWRGTALVLDKWFGALGQTGIDDALEQIRPLFDHPDYNLNNPNRARSLLGAMIANSCAFHRSDGAGYRLAADKIVALDRINPQVAARLANPFVNWRKLLPEQAEGMKAQIEAMLAQGDLSNDLHELLTTSLKG